MYADQMIKQTIRRLESLRNNWAMHKRIWEFFDPDFPVNAGTKSLEAVCAARELIFIKLYLNPLNQL